MRTLRKRLRELIIIRSGEDWMEIGEETQIEKVLWDPEREEIVQSEQIVNALDLLKPIVEALQEK